MTRFFISSAEIESDTILLKGENAAHARVLRLKSGEQVEVCDGQGTVCACTVGEIQDGQYHLHIDSRTSSDTESAIKASIYLAFPKADKLEHVVQKATELGAYEIVVFPSNRCVSKPDPRSIAKKLERWQKIALSAAEQSGRGYVPQVIALSSYTEALKRATGSDKAILFYENEHAVTLRMSLEESKFCSISLLTGPEGGLEEAEVALAREYGLDICTLGKRILRCETAPLCALSAVMYHSGEF